MTLFPKGFVDLADLNEDERIRIITTFCKKHPGKVAGCVTDDDAEKVARYVRKIEATGCGVLSQSRGPVVGTMTLRVTFTDVQ